MVIEEAKKFISEDNASAKENNKRVVTFDKVESLISEMQSMNKSISSIIEETDQADTSTKENTGEEKMVDPGAMWTPNKNRDLNPIEHNGKKNITHMNENEKDKWNRMLKYEVPSDDER